MPTPPVAPPTAITGLPRALLSPRPNCRSLKPFQRADQIFDLHRLGQELLGPGAHGPQDQLPSVEELTTRMLHSGDVARQLLDELEGLVGIGIERDDADVGMRLRHDVGEELVARAFGFEPNHVHAQQHRFQRFARHYRSDRQWPVGGRWS